MLCHAASSMEPPSKRPRLGAALHDDPHQSDDDDDELNYEPEEVSERRDPGIRLARSRATAAFRLKSTFEHIFEKYEHDFSDIGDEIDLRTGDIVVDNGHIERMKNEKDRGLGPDTGSDGVDSAAGRPSTVSPGGQSPSVAEGDEEEDRMIRGDSTALVHKGASGLSQQRALVLGQHSLSGAGPARRPHQLSSFADPRQAPFGATPLHLGSWGPPGALESNWTAPPLQLPQFKSSFGANLFASSYQLPAREGSRSIWGSRPGKDDDEDDNEADAPPRPRLRLPPTKRVPPRPVAMKLIRAPRKDPADSDEEDEILMGPSAVSLPKSPTASVPPQWKGISMDQPTPHTRHKGQEHRGAAGAVSAPVEPLTHDDDDPTSQETSMGKPSNLPPTEAGASSVTLHKDIASKNGSEPVLPNIQQQPAVAAEIHPVVQPTLPTQLVVELRSKHLSTDLSYLDLTHVTDSALDSYLLTPRPQPETTPSSVSNDRIEAAVQDSQDEPVALSDHTIHDSQEQSPSASVPSEPRANAVEEFTANGPLTKTADKKVAYLEYELSDEEAGFLAKAGKKRKRTSASTHPPSSEHASRQLSAAPEPERPKESANGRESGVPLNVSDDSPPAAAVVSPIKTRAALKARSSLPTNTLPGGNSQRLTRGKRRSLPSPSGSGEESLRAAGDKHLEASFPGRPLSPPPETSVEENEDRMEVDPQMPDVAAVGRDKSSQEDDCSGKTEKRPSRTKRRRISREAVVSGVPEESVVGNGHLESGTPSNGHSTSTVDEQPDMSGFGASEMAAIIPSVATEPAPANSEAREATEQPALGAGVNTATEQPILGSEADTATEKSVHDSRTRRRKSEIFDSTEDSVITMAATHSGDTSAVGHRQAISTRPRKRLNRASKVAAATPPPVITRGLADKPAGPTSATPTRELADTATRTPKRRTAASAATPGSIPSTGHRSLISLVPADTDADSEDELTLDSTTFWSLFNQPSSAQSSASKRDRRALLASTPSKSQRRSREKTLARASVGRLSFGLLGVERPSGSDESVMRTPGGTIRKCGEGGAMCGKDFCFTCC